jgi:hypothetical protein
VSQSIPFDEVVATARTIRSESSEAVPERGVAVVERAPLDELPDDIKPEVLNHNLMCPSNDY